MKKVLITLCLGLCITPVFAGELSITPTLIFPSTMDLNLNGSNKVDSQSMIGISADYLFPCGDNFLIGAGGKFLSTMKSNQSGSVGEPLFNMAVPYLDFCYILFKNTTENQSDVGVKQTFVELQTGYPILYGIQQEAMSNITSLHSISANPSYYIGFGLGTEQNHIFANVLYTMTLFHLSGQNAESSTLNGTLWIPATQLNIGYTL